MRLLHLNLQNEITLTSDSAPPSAGYVILSHTWGADNDEVTFADVHDGKGYGKVRYAKLWFCINRAQSDGLMHCWVDTCCINRADLTELSKSITSMFSWYRQAARCYVYLSDVEAGDDSAPLARHIWEGAFRSSRWFTRGWTLQELLAPARVEFYSVEGRFLGDKQTLEAVIHDVTKIPVAALRGTPLSTFSVDERLAWTEGRQTKEPEDRAYCLLGIFGVFMPLIYGEGSNAYTRLREEIRKGADSASSYSPTHWTVPRPVNSLFTGREEVLTDLVSIIGKTLGETLYQDQCRIVISGIGGQGKSELCLQLAHRFRPKFWGVFWVDVSTTSVAEQAFLNLARTLSISARTWQEACLAIANLKHPWLLVLDNADDPAVDYQQFIPCSPCGVVIITSRNDECQRHASHGIRLECLSDAAAQELLFRAARIPKEQNDVFRRDAAEVAALLQSHPLALLQAGAYVSQGFCTLHQYPTEYAQQRQRLLRFNQSQALPRYHDVYATFEASADAMKSMRTVVAEDALELLPLLAVCASRQLPLALFEAVWKGAQEVPLDLDPNMEDPEVELLTPWHVSRLPLLLGVSDDTWNPFRLLSAINLLKSFALLTMNRVDGADSVSMHSLVHAWARDRQTSQEQHEKWLSMACGVSFARRHNVALQIPDRMLRAHVESVVNWNVGTIFGHSPTVLVIRALLNCGRLLLRMRSVKNLSMLLQTIFNTQGLSDVQVDREWVGLYDVAAKCLLENYQGQQAVVLQEQVVEIRDQSQAAHHPSRLASLADLGQAYYENGQAQRAVSLLEEVVEAQLRLLPAHDSELVSSQYTLARAYGGNGQIQEAMKTLEKVYDARKQLLAFNDPLLLDAQAELGRYYTRNGRIADAIIMLEEVVSIEKDSLPPEDTDRLESQSLLAAAYQESGQHERALRLLEQVVEIHDRGADIRHPRRLASLHQLAVLHLVMGEGSKSIEAMKTVLASKKEVFDADHPNVLASEHVLAQAFAETDRAAEGVPLMEHVVKIKQQRLADTDPSRLGSEHLLAIAYLDAQQAQKAVPLLEHVVRIEKQTLAETDSSRLVSEHELARAYLDSQRVQDALTLIKRVVDIRKKTLAKPNSRQLISEHLYAVCLWKSGCRTEGLQMMRDVVEMTRRTRGVADSDRQAFDERLRMFEDELREQSQ